MYSGLQYKEKVTDNIVFYNTKYNVHVYDKFVVNTTCLPWPKFEYVLFLFAGNDLMRKEQYKEALDCYSRAIEKDKANAVYYSNR